MAIHRLHRRVRTTVRHRRGKRYRWLNRSGETLRSSNFAAESPEGNSTGDTQHLCVPCCLSDIRSQIHFRSETMNFPTDLKYTKSDEWIRVTGSEAEAGITDYAQSHLSDIVYVELPEVGAEFKQATAFGSI